MRTLQSGHTLLELITVLSVATLLVGVAAPVARAAVDRHAVRAARDSITSSLALTRATAVARGGASLELDVATGSMRVRLADGQQRGETVHVARLHGVRLELGASGVAEVRYDALGIGRLANRTVRVRRGHAEAGVTISAYGRWRSW